VEAPLPPSEHSLAVPLPIPTTSPPPLRRRPQQPVLFFLHTLISPLLYFPRDSLFLMITPLVLFPQVRFSPEVGPRVLVLPRSFRFLVPLTRPVYPLLPPLFNLVILPVQETCPSHRFFYLPPLFFFCFVSCRPLLPHRGRIAHSDWSRGKILLLSFLSPSEEEFSLIPHPSKRSPSSFPSFFPESVDFAEPPAN